MFIRAVTDAEKEAGNKKLQFCHEGVDQLVCLQEVDSTQ